MSSFSATAADMDNYISYTTAKGGGTSNPAVNDEQIRLYQGSPGGNITVSAKEGVTITEVTIGSAMKTAIKWEIDGTKDANNTSLSANGKATKSGISTKSITCHCCGSDKNSRLYVNYLKVVYTIDAGETPGEGGGEDPVDPTPGTGGTVTYTVSSVTAVTTTGNVPQGSTAVLSGTGSLNGGFIQCTNGKNHTLTLTGYEGYMITGVTIHVKSNSSKGTGSFSVMAGSTTIASITESAFNTSSWNGSWNTTGVDKTLTMTNDSYKIQSGENVTLTINCKSGSSDYNSLYVKSYTITYKPVSSSGGGSEETAYSVTVNQPAEGGGTIEADKDKATKDATVTLTATPDEGYKFSAWDVKDASSNPVSVDANGQFTMPESNVTVTASFVARTQYTISWSVNGETKTLSLANVYEGDALGTLPTPDPSDICTGKVFVGWTTATNNDYKHTTDAPEFITKDTKPSGNTTYYAVFATEGEDQTTSIAGGDWSTGADGDWSTYGTSLYSGNGVKFDDANDYVMSPDISSNAYTRLLLKFKSGHNGGEGSVLKFYAYNKNNKQLTGDDITISPETVVPTEAYTQQNTIYQVNISANEVIGKIMIRMDSKTKNLGMSYCEIFGVSTSYSNYSTTCASSVEYVELGDDFKWSAIEAEVTIDATDNVFPTLTNTHNVPVTYSCSDETIATIVDGAVTLKKEGTVTITAKYEGGISAGTGKEYKAKTVDYTLTVKPAPLEPIAGGVIDILNQAWTGKTNSTYGDVAEKTAENTGHSNAKFVAQCAGDKSSIQLRSNNSNSGVVSTISGGVVKRIEVEWHADTDAARTLQIYGSNTAYIAATDLYGDAKGELLGELNKGEGETTLDFSEWTGDYKYIGFRSKSGAMYLTTVTITWLPTISKVTIDDQIENGSVSVSGAADLNSVAAGTVLTLSNTPSADYKLSAYDVYKTDDATTKVTVADGKFIMPEFDVTISATFELAKTLTSIEITTPATQTTFWQGETFNHNGLKVIAHFDGAEDEDVTDKVTVTGSTATAGTQTVTVSYKEGEVTEDATYTITIKAIPNTKETAYTVADAFDIIDKFGDTDKMYITGFVSQADLVQSTIDQYKNADYWISADGSTNGQQLEAYRGKYLDNADFTSVNQIMVGDEVIIYGKLTKYGSTYEFAAGNYLVSLKRDKQQPELSYTTTEYNVNLGDAFTAPTLNNPHTLAVTYSSNNEDVATVATDGAVIIKAAGTVVITASFAGNDDYVAGEASYTITITDPALAIATLPFEFNGGLNDIVSTAGITQEGLGSDYTSNNAQNSKLKFDHTGDYIIIHFDTKPDKLMYNIKNNSCSGGTFLVQESTDGETYSTICTYQDEFDDKPDALHTLQATSRYVKFIYTEKSSGNVGLGNIKITKLDTRKEAGLAWSTTSYNTYDGDETLAPTLTNPYGLNITYSSSEEDVATIDEAGKLTLKNTGTTTITATFAGNENYKASEVSYTLSYASKWALTYTSNVKVGTNTVMINDTEYEAIKTGTSTVHGSTKVTVPASTHTLHFHAAGWGKDEDVKLIVKNGETELGTFVLSKDAGVKNSSPFILEGTPYLQYYSVALTNITEEATITFEASTTGGKRFVLYGVNQEGGVLPELNRIEIAGEATELTYEVGDVFNPAGLSVNAIYTLAGVEHETVAVDAEDVEWSFDPATIAAETSQVEVTATYEGKTATKTVTGLTVIIPEPEILVTPQTVSFNASQNQSIDTKTINITLKNVTSATVSLAGDGASAFNIDKTQFTESGSLTITPNTSKVGTFKAAITIADDSGVAESKKVTLTLNVTTTDNLNGTWSLITDASNLKANIKVIIASAADSEIYTMGAQNTNNRAAIQSSVVENTLKPELGTKVFTLVNAGDGKFAIKSINGKYLYAASSSSNHLKETDKIDVNSQWTIEINDGVATIKASDSSNRNWIRFNPNNGGTPLFSCYASGQEDICLYTTHVTVNGTTDNTSIPDQSDVTVDNAELTVTTEAEYDNMYIGGNGTVKVVNEVTVNNLYISTTMGATTSGQLSTTPENLNVTGDVFIDITLGKNSKGKNGDPNQWHAFTVPFPVDAMNGVYDLNDNQLKNEVNYAIMDYHGDLRANGQYGWKKYRGILVPGTFYLMTVDGERTTYRFKKVKDAAIVAPTTKAITAYNGTGDATKDKDKGWNGVGNPTLMHGKVAYNALVLNPEKYIYEAYEAEEVAFTVGTPFFIQAATDGTMTIAAETSSSLAPAPARRAAAAVENIKVMLGNSDYTDRLYVSASEDAINEYEIGKDLGKMAMTSTPSVVQISALAYDTRLCMIDAPMANNEALVALNLYAPANGEYTLSIEAQDNEKVYLLHEGTFVWDLSMSEYPITLNKGDNTGYSILVHRADAPTSVETIDGTNNQTEKLIHNGNLYILHNGKVFDAVGTMLK